VNVSVQSVLVIGPLSSDPPHPDEPTASDPASKHPNERKLILFMRGIVAAALPPHKRKAPPGPLLRSDIEKREVQKNIGKRPTKDC
jgi:hypothetical protein